LAFKTFFMREPNYHQALGAAWRLLWHNKIIWILGLLSVFAGQFGLGDFAGRLMLWGDKVMANQDFLDLKMYFQGWTNFNDLTDLGLVLVGFIVLAILVGLVFVSVTAQGALIAASADWYKKNRVDKLSQAWHESAGHFWRLFSINIGEKAILCLMLLGLLALWQFVPAGGGWLSTALSVILSAVGFVVAFAAAAIAVYASGYVIEDNYSLWRATASGFHLFFRHFSVSLELGVILFIAGVVMLALIIAGSTLIMFLAALIWLIGAVSGLSSILWLGVAVYSALFMLLVIWLGSLFNAFATGAWIYLFMQMKQTGLSSKVWGTLRRLFGRS